LTAQSPTSVFELEGDTVTGNLSPPLDDWNLLNGNGTCNPTPCQPGAAGASLARTFVSEPVSLEVFTQGGSKDPSDTTAWKWKSGSTPDKDALLHGYAALYANGSGQAIIVLGADRFAVNGDANIGAWLFKNNVGPQPDGTFGPSAHANGDVFILSAFTGGGSQPGLTVYKWNTACSKGVRNPVPTYPGPSSPPNSCGDTNLELVFAANSGDLCTLTSPACARVNAPTTPGAIDSSGTILAPWYDVSKFGGTGSTGQIPPAGFFEAGINLDVLGLTAGDSCFNTFVMETRSSQTPSAVLKDFLAGNLNFCGSVSISKVCETGSKIEGSPDVIRYTFDGGVKNTSAINTTLFDATVTDTFPSGAFTISNKVLRCGGTLSGGVCTGGTPGVDNGDGTFSCTFSSSIAQANTASYCGSFDSDSILGGNTLNHVVVAAARTSGGNKVLGNNADWPAACTLSLSPQLTLSKTCNTTIDQNVGGHIVIGVDFSSSVCNSSGAGSADVTGIALSDSIYGSLPLTSTSLEPGACATFGVPNALHVEPPTCNAGADGRCAISDTVTLTSATGAFGTTVTSNSPIPATCRVCPNGSCSSMAP
jgi:hypothetical protein